MPDIDINTGFRARVDFEFAKPDGKPGKTDGPPRVTSDNGDVFAVMMEGERAFFARAINSGQANITIEADVDMGDGVQLVQRVLTARATDQLADHVTVQVSEQEADPED